MRPASLSSLRALFGAVALFAAGLVGAQAPEDFPTLKGSSQRTGTNGNPAGSSPGLLRRESSTTGVPNGSLRWIQPMVSATPVNALRLNEVNPLKTIIDNTDDGDPKQTDSAGNDVGPFDPLPNGTVVRVPAYPPFPLPLPPDAWQRPNEADEAIFPYVPIRRRNVNGTFGRDVNPRWPAYEYVRTVASAPGRDPRIPINPALLKTFTWSFTPSVNTTPNPPFTVVQDPTRRSYALYVQIPEGQTTVGGVLVPRQRFFVYEVTYGGNRKYVFVLDTNLAGVGFVRIGGPDVVFPYDGVNPLRLTLYNTIPRDGDGELTETASRLVYADAAEFSGNTGSSAPNRGSIFATPTQAGFGGADIRVVSARNEVENNDTATDPGFLTPPPTNSSAVVTSYVYNTGVPRWTFRLDGADGAQTLTVEDDAATVANGGFTPDSTTAYRFLGTRLLLSPVAGATPTANVLVDPGASLADGAYDIQMYVGGKSGAVPGAPELATAAQYEIFEGGVSAGVFTLDESGGEPGYRRLGVRRYQHSAAAPLTVQVYNSTGNVAGDAGRSVAVDAFRFLVPGQNSVVSTPLQATALVRQTVGTDPVPTNVVLIADERGRLHLVDAAGDPATGQTRTYWVYPTDTSTGQKDPNTDPSAPAAINPLRDGTNGLEATLPTFFDLSSAAIRRLTVLDGGGNPVQRDYLYIGAGNGRVYAIAMEGRGDGGIAPGQPGTTFRRWTYPATYPATEEPTNLGKIASVVAGNVGGVETIYAATESGRVFALSALGGSNGEYGDAGLTAGAPIWRYPAANAPTLGEIQGAPALDVAGNRLFVPTFTKNNTPGALISLNATTGALNWSFSADGVTNPFTLDFRSGPAYVSAVELNDPAFNGAPAAPDSVFAMNENGYVYALDAGTGAELWRTNELQSGGRGSLGYLRLSSFDQAGATGLFPAITVPTENGRFATLFARQGDTTIFGNRLAYGATVDARITASMAVGNRWMYGASEDGYLYAFSDATNPGASLPGGFIPNISEDAVDNDPDPTLAAFRNAEIGLLSRQGFVTLRQTQNGGTSTQDFATVIDNAATWTSPDGRIKAPFRSGRTSPVFEWGETIYLLVYNFPATDTDVGGRPIAPPVVEALVTTQGKAARPIVAEARIFRDRTSAAPDGGYAVIQIPLTSGGQTSLPPGPGSIQISIRTSAGNTAYLPQQISLNPARSRLAYRIANPLGIAMQPPGGTAQTQYTLGYTTNAADNDNTENGVGPSAFGNVPGRDPTLLATTFGIGNNGQSRTQPVIVYDRSLMTLLRGEGRGLDNVRFERRDFEWQGFAASVVKGMAATYGPVFAAMEDLPVNLPNDSLDYPNIRRERLSATKDPNGNAENPLFNGVALKGPRDAAGNPVTEATGATRVLVPTIFSLKLDIPRYQPPAFVPQLSQVADSAGTFLPQGYAARVGVFVDSDGNGALNQSREAFRPFSLFASVAPDERLVVNTPTLDLGSLSAGTGYDTRLAYTATAPYRVMGAPISPWGGAYAGMFKGFEARNEGNVNLLNVRVAKGSLDANGVTPVVYPWQVFSLTNDANSAWLDASLDVWSDLDVTFAPAWAAGRNEVVAPKPRVTDVAGRLILTNPIKRFNPSLGGADGNPLIQGFPSRDPRIGVTLPLGFPIGSYSQTLRLIEDYRFGTPATNNDELLSLAYAQNGQVDPVESYSDPGLRLSFTVVETPLTGDTPLARGDTRLAENPPSIRWSAPYVAEQVDAGSNRSPAQEQDDVNNGRVTKWGSRQPAAIRSLNGAMGLVFASNRPQWIPTQDAAPTDGAAYRLWFAGLAGSDPGPERIGRAPESQTRDLNRFVPNNPQRFWRQGAGAYPGGTAASLFPPTAAGGAAIEGSQTFGLPALPANGFADPLQYGAPGATNFPSVTLAFVGSAYRTGSAGNVTDSRLFATSYSLAQDGTPTVGAPVGLDFAPDARKGRPAVVQSNAPTGGAGATIVFAASVNNSPRLWFTRFNGTAFTAPLALNVGNAFESVSDPAASLRAYGNGTAMQIAFTGRLRGRTSSEVFLMNVVLGPDHLPLQPLQFVYFQIAGERATLDPASGQLRLRGAYLREPSPAGPGNVPPAYDDNVGIGTPLPDIRTERRSDRESRIETSTSTAIGGRILFDRNAGSLRLIGSALPPTANLLVSYQSAILRVSEAANAGYTSPNLLQDPRVAPGNLTPSGDAYWFLPNGGIAPVGDAGTFADRTYLVYTRGSAAGGGVTRPFSVSFRPGVRIGREIATNADGSLAEPVTVTGANGRYQVDPAGGRIYFTRNDEGRVVTVQVGADPPITGPVGIVGETLESPVPIGRPLDETNMFAFFDPVFAQTPRRGLMWMFWTSTRNGSPNIFFQSVAPALSAPIPSP